MNTFVVEVQDPIVDLTRLTRSRPEGLSGFMRLRNEAEYLALSIDSWLPILDELVIVYNNCQDTTAEIVEEYAERYPNKIKAYHYVPVVYPPGSDGFLTETETSYHSFCNYSNFALLETTYACVVKIDGDLVIPDESIRAKVYQKYQQLRENRHQVQPLSGINIIPSPINGGGIKVPSSSKFCGLYGDLCMFFVDKSTYYIRRNAVEAMSFGEEKELLPRLFTYYHLKFARRDYGIANYSLDENRNSVYLPKTWVFLWFLRLLDLRLVLKEIEDALPYPDTTHWDLPQVNDYKWDAMRHLWQNTRSFGSLPGLLNEMLGHYQRNGNSFSRVLARILLKCRMFSK